MDEDGEFIHLIIGAVVGGIVNWATHGFQFNAKGLGYFAVGAAVGTLSAMGGAWAAATFKAVGVAAGVGIGTVSGAAIGGGSSFLLNGGNNLIAGNNFFNNWKSSLISGAVNGAITGAIGGGITGGKEALKQGKNVWWGNEVANKRTQWSLVNTDLPDQIVEFDISKVGSNDLNNYVPTTFSEINDYFGGTGSYESYVKNTNYITDEGVYLSPRGGYDNLLSKNFDATIFDHFKLQDANYMQSIKDSGKMISVHMKHSGVFHADNIRSIKYYPSKTVIRLRIGSYNFKNLVNNYFKTWSIGGIK